MPIRYEVVSQVLITSGEGTLLVYANGLLPVGELTWEEVEQIIDRLSGEGWNLVSFVNRTSPGTNRREIELFFQRQILPDIPLEP